MNQNFKIEAKTNAKSNNRTCQANANYINERIQKQQQQQKEISALPHKQQQQQHSLSIMPPYRYANSDPSSVASSLSLLPLTRRRWFQRQTCLFCIIAAFMFGLLLGVFVPLLDLSNVFTNLSNTPKTIPLMFNTHDADATAAHNFHLPSLTEANWITQQQQKMATATNRSTITTTKTTTTTDNLNAAPAPALSAFSVAFISEHHTKVGAEEILSDSVHTPNVAFKSLNKRDFHLSRGDDEMLGQVADERRVLKMLLHHPEGALNDNGDLELLTKQNVLHKPKVQKTPTTTTVSSSSQPQTPTILKGDIYWGELVERALPQGFSAQDTRDWNAYVGSQTTDVQRLESGCGRMQNRLLIFRDGTRACARYRQNTDQIQGELFSFYLGRLLNMSNLAPSAILTVNVETDKWSSVVRDITQAQWKQQRPVVLTRWLPNLEPAGIPQPFQPIDRHLNKYDVWNITKRLMAPHASDLSWAPSADDAAVVDAPMDLAITPNSLALQRLVELAQWSDLIVFDYLIANLDRVVNNLYNYQWNAEIMAAPAHNLARQSNSQLLIFLDNESGLLHGYRLLKKYEAYHGLLLNNLCVFREPTIRALRELREAGAGRKLRELFEATTSDEVRDVLPTLPDKSIKILIDRIDRVLGQVDNCKQLMSAR